MELPTAIPYFAAVALITEAKLPIQAWAPLLGMYNVIFVLPPIALLAGHVVFGKRLAETYATLRLRLQEGAQETMLWVAGLVGGALFVTGMIELAARLR
jgi:Sap, sulfolipid-1-addressing protein